MSKPFPRSAIPVQSRPAPTPKPPKRPIGYGICMHHQPLTIESKLDKILTQLEYNSEMLEYLIENRSS